MTPRLQYLAGAAAGTCLTAILVWVADQLRRDSIRPGDDATGGRGAPVDAPPRVGGA
jgi:hypothetical protein